MATLVLPIRSDFKAYEFKVDLEGAIYTLEFGFNTRASRWYMSIYDQTKTELIVGDIPVLINVPLTDQYVVEGLPPGRFIAINETGLKEQATSENFGTVIKLLYQESE